MNHKKSDLQQMKERVDRLTKLLEEKDI
jgi:hypothetical protein